MINSLSMVDLGAIEKRLLAHYAIPSRRMGKTLHMEEAMRRYGASDATIARKMEEGSNEMMKLQIMPRINREFPPHWPKIEDLT